MLDDCAAGHGEKLSRNPPINSRDDGICDYSKYIENAFRFELFSLLIRRFSWIDHLPGTMATDADNLLWGERYDALDIFRGLAALLVVLHHCSNLGLGHEAVMIFFVISGYCICASAEACLRKGMGLRQFMWRRVHRIYPPYFLAIVLFSLTRVVRWYWLKEDFVRPPTQWLQNLTMTQWLSLLHHPLPYAAQNPKLFVAAFWSLCYEEQFYLVVGLTMLLGAFSVRRWALLALLIGSIVWLVAMPKLAYGIFIEYWLQFAVGMVLFYRLCRVRSAVLRRLIDAAFLIVSVTCWGACWKYGLAANQRPVTEELAIVTSFAFVLVLLRPANGLIKRSGIGRALMWLGAISYSLYLIHQFNIHIVKSIALHLCPGRLAFANIPVQLVLHVLFAAVFWYLCERPFLNRSVSVPVRPGTSAGTPAVPSDVIVPLDVNPREVTASSWGSSPG
jgi:peptidoglycan/LPS O-acetylase OafA/YrhL